MANAFKKKVYDDLKEQLTDKSVRIIGYDYGYNLVEIASTPKQLVELLKNGNTRGVVADNTGIGSVAFDIPTKRSASELEITPNTNAVDYATENLLEGSTSIEDLEKKTVSSNLFVHKLHDLLASKTKSSLDISNIYLQNSKLPIFKILYVYRDNLTFCITEHQICLMTSCGLITIHSAKHDVEPDWVFGLLSKHLRIRKEHLIEVF
ncbi:hypothetical protein COF68_06105 [Bacillus toyonensis]|uniref:hypothetical protein n=1 Tax=Bacillus toyonensis TaxID=155322 RepID=UPI000BFCC587|nr:hypothetical protein [Bacillus toyonensis]PHE64407.1 hypothetical protein COF68_06105 [Bacillus toyonensis]